MLKVAEKPTASQVKNLFKPIKGDLTEFQEHFERLMTSDVRIVDRVAKYIVKHKGKQFRPALLVATARANGIPTERTYITAVVVELLHTATLLHDDVVDEAELRRGFPTISRIWKNKVAVLMGDYLLAKSLISATETGSLETMNIVANVAKRLSKGELLQYQKSRNLDITEAEYFKLIGNKTASLISACCELGALTVDVSSQHRELMRQYGENLGLAFQIKDDLLDYQSKSGILGKPVGLDLKERKITLPLIYALEECSEKMKRKIIRRIKKGAGKEEVRYIISFVREFNGLQRAQTTAQRYIEAAKANLKHLPATPARKVLENLADFVVNRQK